MHRPGLWLILSLIFASPAAAAMQVAYVYAPDAAAVAELASYPVNLEEPDFPDWARIAASAGVVDQLRAAGFEVEVAIEDLTAWAAARMRPPDPRDKLPSGAKVELNHYFTHEEAEAFLLDLQAAHSDIMSVETIGQSVLGRDLWLVKISDNVAVNEPEPALIFDHCIHGDELSGCALGFFIIQWLVEGYGVDDEITRLVDEREIFVAPVDNPDGNDPAERSRYNANGIDLNRDFGYMWVYLYYADEPHSQPETRALSQVWRRGQPFSFGLSAHAGAVYFIYPWAFHYDNAPEQRELNRLGEQYCYPNHATDPRMGRWGQASLMLGGAVYDSTMDEMLGADGALGTGVELTGCKECLWLRTANAAAANRPAVLWLIDEMGRGLHGRALDAGTLAPVEATIKVGARWPSYNDPEVGDFHHYLRPADYPVRVIANGYDEQNLVAHVEDEAPPQLDVELAPSSRRTTFAVRIVNNSVYEYAPPDPPLGFNFLGRPDGATLPLGIAGFATLDLSRDGITDGPGADIAVYEGWDPTGDEPFELWGGDQPYGPWTLIGAGVGTTEFDLADSGLASVRYVQVRDASSAAESGKAVWPGFDLDAVGSPGLLANFTASPQFVAPGGTVSFTDVSRGGPTGWLWDFGDGETSTDHNPSHAYANLGFYTVSLTIDGPGGPDTIVKRDLIGVVDAPTAEFSGAPQSLTAGETVQFADASTGYVTAYHWEFGDNYTSAEKDPAHAYRKAGDYSVVLTITGLVGGDEEVKYDYIHVDPAADDDDDDDNDDNDDIDDDDNDNDDDDNNDNDDNDDNDDNNDNNDYAADDDNDATSGSDGEDSGGCGC